MRKYLMIEGSPCYNMDSYKLVLCKKSLEQGKILHSSEKEFKDIVIEGLTYYAYIGDHRVTISGRGISDIVHYCDEYGEKQYYSRHYTISKTNFKKYFKIIPDEDLHDISEAEDRYGYIVVTYPKYYRIEPKNKL